MVIWSARARADLKTIHDYIAKDSPFNAKSVVRELLSKVDSLTAELPHVGRKAPELNDEPRMVPSADGAVPGGITK